VHVRIRVSARSYSFEFSCFSSIRSSYSPDTRKKPNFWQPRFERLGNFEEERGYLPILDTTFSLHVCIQTQRHIEGGCVNVKERVKPIMKEYAAREKEKTLSRLLLT